MGLAGLAACKHTATAPLLDLVAQTDKPLYSLATDRMARISLANRSDRSVYLPMDTYVLCERLRDGVWVDAFAWLTADGLTPTLALPPGQTLSDNLYLSAYLPNRPGTYRIRYLVYADRAVQTLVPLEKRVSPPFTVTQ
ncbi:MAG: hypothetical protein NVS9B3_11590 [Gemmatimonadaceae bacterium]